MPFLIYYGCSKLLKARAVFYWGTHTRFTVSVGIDPSLTKAVLEVPIVYAWTRELELVLYGKCIFNIIRIRVLELAVRETIFCPGPPPQKITAWPGTNYTARRGRAATWVYPRMRAADPFRWAQGTHYPGEGVVSHSLESSSLIATIVSHHLPVNLWPSLRLPSAIWLPPKNLPAIHMVHTCKYMP